MILQFNQNNIINPSKEIDFTLLKLTLDTIFATNTTFSINLGLIDCDFGIELTENQIIQANNIFINHMGSKIYKLTDKITTDYDLDNIDYDLKGLHKKRIFNLGELRVIEYYKNFDLNTQTYSDLVVKETRKYLRDTSTGLCYSRLISIYWYLTNNEIGYSIINRPKYYSFAESRAEIRERRNNLVSDAEAYVLYILSMNFTSQEVMTKSVALLTAIKQVKDLYLEGVAEPIINLVSSTNNIIDDLFIDSTLISQVKTTLLSIFTYNFTAQVE